ncbi:hypothetical protein ACHAW5_005421 [Stephanodiscus triporus]|uniref:MutL C-terminal dimerisation domain-containing protein n=1 Tax=Stephanodiscus triporus TaxID=2934178 RepID=A0ABD3NW23_9STRA
MGDVWRMFDPVVASSTTGRRRPACVLSFTLPTNMYDVNLSPDKREVMFTEEAAMAELIKEGLMALWSDQIEGKFEANEVESRSNKNAARRGCYDNELEAVTNSNKCSLNGLPLNVEEDEKLGTFANTNAEDDDIDYVTPKLRRRIADKSGPLVTPLDPGVSNELANDRAKASSALLEDCREVKCDELSGGDNGCAPPISVENTLQSTDRTALLDRNDTISEHERDDHRNRQQSQSSWTMLQLPERAREQDRRNWEQMRLKFQRIDNAQIRQDLDRILPPSVDEDEDFGHDKARRKSSSSMAVSASCSRRPMTINISTANDDTSTSDRSMARRQPKRSKQKKNQDVTSFLDSFAYSSTKSAEDATDSDCESHTGLDELGKNEENDAPKTLNHGKSSRSTQNGGTARMIVGRRAVEKRPRSSYRETSVDESNESLSSTARLQPSPPLDEQVVDHVNDKEAETPVEVVWNSFSGTQNVIYQSLNARLMMQKTRKYLQSAVERKICRDRDAVDLTVDDTAASKKESTVNLCKEDFLHMSIIGQFNLGFILARCRNQNLWILDQHACDEKYNFERLCKETVIHEQKLIAPLPLELSPSEEHCVLEHRDVFERNGFRLSYDPNKAPRHRLSLTALPYSGSGGDGKKAVQFGKEDVGALCAMLGADGTSSSDGYLAGFDTGVQGSVIAGVNAVRRYAGMSSQGGARSDGIVGSSIVRLPKAIAMFANRACRGSIMIGTALSEKEQMDILNKLDKTDVPWNCAHGRPTMSHIRSLIECLIADDDAMVLHVAGPSLSVVGDL